MIAKAFGLATLTVALIALADLVVHPAGTQVLANSAVTVQKTATNALLGKTS